MERLIIVVLFVLFSISGKAQDAKLEFEKLFNTRFISSDSSDKIVHLKYTTNSTYYDKSIREFNSTGDLYMGKDVEFCQTDSYEIFQNSALSVFVDKAKKQLMLSDFQDRGGFFKNLKISQRKVLVDSSCISMVKDTVADNVRVNYFILKTKPTLEKMSGIKEIEYFFRSDNKFLYKILIRYSKRSSSKEYSMLFEEINRFKDADFGSKYLSKYFTKKGVIKQDYRQFQIVDNRKVKK